MTGLIVHGWLRDHGIDDYSASSLAVQGFARESLPISGALVNRDSVPSYNEYIGRRDLPGWNLTTNSAGLFQYPPMRHNQPRDWTTRIEDTLAARRAEGSLSAIAPWPENSVHRAGGTPPPVTGRMDPTISSSARYSAVEDDDAVSLGSPGDP